MMKFRMMMIRKSREIYDLLIMKIDTQLFVWKTRVAAHWMKPMKIWE